MISNIQHLIGKIVGHYRLEQILGTGGAGVVFLGRSTTSSNRLRAVKLLIPPFQLTQDEQHKFRLRFLREAELLSKLSHPNILPVETFGTDDETGFTYMIMPYISGGTLEQVIEQGPLPIIELPNYIWPLANALDYAHGRNIIHRDIKPANILSGQKQLYLADFGIAKLFETGIPTLTTANQMVGTPAYMAPEQITNKEISAATDVYGFATVVYQLLTGELPFKATTLMGIISQILMEQPPVPHSIRPELPSSMSDAIVRALHKDPTKRFPSAGIFANALLHELQQRPLPNPEREEMLDTHISTRNTPTHITPIPDSTPFTIPTPSRPSPTVTPPAGPASFIATPPSGPHAPFTTTPPSRPMPTGPASQPSQPSQHLTPPPAYTNTNTIAGQTPKPASQPIPLQPVLPTSTSFPTSATGTTHIPPQPVHTVHNPTHSAYQPAPPTSPPVGAPPRPPHLKPLTIIGISILVVLLIATGTGLYLFLKPRASTGIIEESPQGKVETAKPLAEIGSCGGFSDEFDHTGYADAGHWQWIAQENAEKLFAEGHILITAAEGQDLYRDQYRENTSAPKLMQSLNGDFTIETELEFSPAYTYQGAGILLWQDNKNFVRLEYGYGDMSGIIFEQEKDGYHEKMVSPFSSDEWTIPTDANKVKLRLKKTGESVQAWWQDPTSHSDWQEVGEATTTLGQDILAGVAVLNAPQDPNPDPLKAPVTAQFHDVKVTCD